LLRLGFEIPLKWRLAAQRAVLSAAHSNDVRGVREPFVARASLLVCGLLTEAKGRAESPRVIRLRCG